MISRFTLLASASALALDTVNCGGSSTPESNTPNTAPPEVSVPATNDPTDSAAVSGSDSPAPASPLSDQQIAAVTDAVNTAEIEQAQLARSKSTNDQVQSFAGMMIEHHGQAKRKQTTLGIAEAESPLSLKLAAKTHTTIEQLKQKSGSEFDRAYLQAQIDGHQEVLDTIDRQLLPDAKNAQLKAYLEELRPQVAEHLERAKSAQDALASADSSSRPRAASKQ
jgi:putative membrane protein